MVKSFSNLLTISQAMSISRVVKQLVSILGQFVLQRVVCFVSFRFYILQPGENNYPRRGWGRGALTASLDLELLVNSC